MKAEAPYRRRLAMGGYGVWLVSCTVFFVLGLMLGKVPSRSAKTAVPVTKIETADDLPVGDQPLRVAGAQYAVWVTSVATANEANQTVRDLNRRGFTSAYITRPTEGNTLYVVKVGLYNLPTANQVAEELQKDLGFRSARVMTEAEKTEQPSGDGKTQ
jgi:hypothetical protein